MSDADPTVYLNQRTGESVTLVARADGKRVLRGTPNEVTAGLKVFETMMLPATGGSSFSVPPPVARVEVDGPPVIGCIQRIDLTHSALTSCEVEVAIVFVPLAPPPRPQPETP